MAVDCESRKFPYGSDTNHNNNKSYLDGKYMFAQNTYDIPDRGNNVIRNSESNTRINRDILENGNIFNCGGDASSLSNYSTPLTSPRKSVELEVIKSAHSAPIENNVERNSKSNNISIPVASKTSSPRKDTQLKEPLLSNANDKANRRDRQNCFQGNALSHTPDDLEPAENNGNKICNGAVRIEISSSDCLADVPDKFPKEIYKTFIAALILVFSFFTTTTSLAMVHERLPERPRYAPLPDIFLDSVTARDWALAVSEIIIVVTTHTTGLILILHKRRFIVLRRLFFLLSILYLMRSLTMFVTVMPVSSKTYYCSPKANSTEPITILTHSLVLFSGMGLTINGRHTYCGDYIYSGHTTILVMSYLMVREYSPRRFWALHWAIWSMSVVGVLMVLVSHGHYTVDVILAYYITTRLFWAYHSMANNEELKSKTNENNFSTREWWFFLFDYFERNVRGPLPHEYNWPLPWPRSFCGRSSYS